MEELYDYYKKIQMDYVSVSIILVVKILKNQTGSMFLLKVFLIVRKKDILIGIQEQSITLQDMRFGSNSNYYIKVSFR